MTEPRNGTMPYMLTMKVMELADLLGQWPDDAKQIDPRAWDHLGVYMPPISPQREGGEK